jgi:hypothetical protein
MNEHEEIAKALKMRHCGRTLRRSTTNYTNCSRLIPRTKPLNLKIKK